MSVAVGSVELMFDTAETVIRVPAEVLAARPHGLEVAARVADLAEALARAVTDPPAAAGDRSRGRGRG